MENEPSRENFPFSHRTSCVHVGGRERVCLFFHKLAAPRMFSLDGFKSSLESARMVSRYVLVRTKNKPVVQGFVNNNLVTASPSA